MENSTSKSVHPRGFVGEIEDFIEIAQELSFEASIINGVSVTSVFKEYTLLDVRRMVRIGNRRFLEDKLWMERIVANHKMKERKKLLKDMNRDIKKLTHPSLRKKAKGPTISEYKAQMKDKMDTVYKVGGDK